MVDERAGGKHTNSSISRRRFTLAVVIASIAAAFGSLLSFLKVLAPKQKGGGYVSTIKPRDRLVYARGSNTGNYINISSLNTGDAVLAYPEGKTSNPANLVQLIKLDEKVYKSPTHLNLTDQGLVAYSAICTHLGCTVSWVENRKTPDTSYTECFCHNSIFDPTRGAKVLGGPAPIPLAQIGVKVRDDGTLIFTSGFTGPIGPQV
ncbi:MAG: ubiquinol-cytochrome c reductase iron-sulfur subunit [Acidobacteria bacterium]|nr:ubiquinol-cytochrome c reductase iron-sulfur subunit [Acidobacteriota bacterium]